jgi:predicted ATP-dependent serine protease
MIVMSFERFGSTTELALLSMSSVGLSDVDKPELFVSKSLLNKNQEGSAVAVITEGSRPILAEIQCLVGRSITSYNSKISPRRTADGLFTSLCYYCVNQVYLRRITLKIVAHLCSH